MMSDMINECTVETCIMTKVTSKVAGFSLPEEEITQVSEVANMMMTII